MLSVCFVMKFEGFEFNISVINDCYLTVNIVDVATLADIGGVSGIDFTGWSVIQNLWLWVC